MPYTKEALKIELLSDPQLLNYKANISTVTVDGVERKYITDGQAIADKLNAPLATVDVDIDNLTPNQVFLAIEPAAWEALIEAKRDWLRVFLAQEQISMQHPNARAFFQATFPAGSATRTALLALMRRKGSRAEQLFGAGCVVTYHQVGEAFHA